MKIYTRKGDGGRTALFGGGRVPKDDLRVEAYGTVDELNSVLGRALVSIRDEGVRRRLEPIRHDLFALGANLATPPGEGDRPRPEVPELPAGRVPEMERWIDEATESLEPLKNFILPGGGAGGADLHVARTVCRRAERRVVALAGEAEVDEDVIRYLNRLSDLLFVFARLENRHSETGDVIWRSEEAEGA